MSDVTIPELTLLTSIDRAADLFEVSDTSDSGNSKRTTVNSMLNVTSQPASIDDIQTLTNKTLTAPAISSPVLSGTITGTYTLGGTPTFPSAVATLTGSQTLTNKVLTSPTINSPTITNPTITVDAISEFTSANGVTIDGLNIKDGKVGANGINTASIEDGAITTAKLNTSSGEIGGVWQPAVPTLTNMTLGSGTLTAFYQQVGKNVQFRGTFTLGAGSTVGTNPIISLPVTASSTYSFTNTYLNTVGLVDTGNNNFIGSIRLETSTTALFVVYRSDATYINTNSVTATVPFTWGSGDIISWNVIYEAA